MRNKSGLFCILMVIVLMVFYVLPMSFLFFNIQELRKTDDDVKNSIEELKKANEPVDTSRSFEKLKDGTISIESGKLIVQKGIKMKYDSEEELLYFDGYIENKSKEDFYGVDLEIELYDKSNVIIGSTSFYLPYIKKDQKWKIYANYSDTNMKDVKNFQIASVDYETKSSTN